MLSVECCMFNLNKQHSIDNTHLTNKKTKNEKI